MLPDPLTRSDAAWLAEGARATLHLGCGYWPTTEELDDMGKQKRRCHEMAPKKSNGWVDVSGPLSISLESGQSASLCKQKGMYLPKCSASGLFENVAMKWQ